MNQTKFINWLNLHFSEVLITDTDFRVNCPFCDNDTNHHMHISKIKLVAHCFRCNWGGHRNKFMLEFLGHNGLKDYLTDSIEEMYMPLADRLTEFLGKFDSPEPLIQNSPDIIMEMPDWFIRFDSIIYNNLYVNAINTYAITRIGIDNVLRHGIGYCKDLNSKFAHRMIIPIERGYFQARAISDNQKAKYVNPDIPIGDRLFNGSALELYDKVYICEGAISAIAIGNDAIATLTKSAHKEQIDRMIESKVRIFVIAYDAETEYSSGLLKLAKLLHENGKNITIRSYKYGDPDSCSEFTEMIYDTKYEIIGKISNFHQNRKTINLFR